MKTIENDSLLVASYIARFEIFMENIGIVVLGDSFTIPESFISICHSKLILLVTKVK